MSKFLLRSICEAFLIYVVFQIINRIVPANVSRMLSLFVLVGILVFVVGIFLRECVWKWWKRPETDEERERSLGGFWIQMAKVWWRQVWPGNDSNT